MFVTLQPQPDPTARLISHLVIGGLVFYVVGRRAGPAGSLLSAALSIGAHEALDAPVAKALAEAGI